MRHSLLPCGFFLVVSSAACDSPPLAGSPDMLGSSVASLTLDPEQAVDVPVLGGIGTASAGVRVAWSGSRYLAVWSQSGLGVQAMRIAPDGAREDARSFDIAGCDSGPAVVFSGGFQIVCESSGTLELWRVTQTGVRRTGFLPGAGRWPDIAVGSGDLMMASQYYITGEGIIQVTRYDGSAFSPQIQVASDAVSAPRIAARPGEDYLVVWTDDSDDVRGRLLAPDGTPGSSVAIATTAAIERSAAVARAGSSYAVVWEEAVAGGAQIRGALVDPGGAVGTPVDISLVRAVATAPTILCDATCTVVWTGGAAAGSAALRVRRLDLALAPLGGERVLLDRPAAQGPAAIAGVGGADYVVWTDGQSGTVEPYGAVATEDGDRLSLGEPSLLAIGDAQRSAPAVAAANASWLVAWQDTRNGGSDLFGRRFGLDGAPRTAAARPIHEEPWIQREVALAWNGSQYLAAWFHDEPSPTEVRVTRIEANGTIVDPAGITAGRAGNAVGLDVASGGAGGWLVAWHRGTGSAIKIQAAVVRPDGTTTTPIDVSPAGGSPAIAYDPGTDLYLLVWEERQDSTAWLVRAVRISSSGVALDPSPVTLATVSYKWAPSPDVAFGSGRFLIAFIDDDRLFALRVRVSGGSIEALDPAPFPLDPAPAYRQRSPAVTFAARSFLVAYEWVAPGGGSYDIHGVQVSPGGAVQGPGFVLADGPLAEMTPAFAGASQGRALLAFARIEPFNNDVSTTRSTVYVRRLVVAYPNGATCTSDDQCDSGFCVNGRCCDSAVCP